MRLMDNQQLNRKGMTKHIRYWLLAITVLLGVLIYLMSIPKSLVPPLTLPIDQLLSIEQANKLREQSYGLGIEFIVRDKEAMITLLKQAWQGDKNALVNAIHMLADANSGTDSDSEIPWQRNNFDTFLHENRHLLVNDKGEPLVEPKALKSKTLAWELFYELAELGHPEASYQAAKGLMYRKLTPEEEQKIQHYLENALAGGYKVKWDMANLIFFPGADDTFKPKENNPFNELHLIPLTQRRTNIDPEQAKIAISYYQEDMMCGSPIVMMRMAEAYYLGVGVERDILQANAWARVANYSVHIAMEKEKAGSYKRASAFNQSLQKIVEEIIDKTDPSLFAAQSMQAQQKARELFAQMQFGENSYSKREPVPPMP